MTFETSLTTHFETIFGARRPAVLGVAVSGGGDSLALLHLLHRWGQVPLHAVTVDHALRAGAADEARGVAETCTALGVPHDSLVWDHRSSEPGNLQDNARRARYRLIREWASRRGVTDIALGHTADDQAETLLMQLARRAGVDGLAGMAAAKAEGGIVWHRPLLDQSRASLRGWLSTENIRWIDDPSNDDTRFDRIKARQAMALLAPLGIDSASLGAVARNMAASRAALDHATKVLAGQAVRIDRGDMLIVRDALQEAPPEITRRLIAACLGWIASSDYPPRQSAQAKVMQAVLAGNDMTLHCCLILPDAQSIRITREPAAVSLTCTPTDALWDGRWRCEGPHRPDLTIRALGETGLRSYPDWRDIGLPRASLLASPAIWEVERLIAAPLAGTQDEWSARIVADSPFA